MSTPRSRGYYTMVGLFTSLVIIYIVILAISPEPVEWNDTFTKEDKNPFGAYVAYEQLQDFFVSGEIESPKIPLYELPDDSTANPQLKNYIFINSVFSPDIYGFKNLLKKVENGHTALIVAQFFNRKIEDTLGIKTEFQLEGLLQPFDSLELSDLLNRKADSSILRQPFRHAADSVSFVNPQLGDSTIYNFSMQRMSIYFTEVDSSRTTVIAQNGLKAPNLIRIKHGKGHLIVGTSPHSFTNVFLLYGNHDGYVQNVFSYLPKDNDVYWDEYYKVENLARVEASRSPLSYIRSQEALFWAFRIIVFSLLIYMIFYSKRMQRIIPLKPPVPNSTMIFTETVGRMYFRSGDHKNIAEKKIKIFLNHIRQKYFLQTQLFTDEFLSRLSAKSGVPRQEVKYLFRKIDLIRNTTALTENELIEFSNEIEQFYKTAGR